MANVFASNKFTGNSRFRFAKLVTEQNTFIKSFLASSDIKTKAFYKEVIQRKDIVNVSKMKKITFEANTIGDFGVDSTHLVNMITSKIDLLKKADDHLAENLTINAKKLSLTASSDMIIYILCLLLFYFLL